MQLYLEYLSLSGILAIASTISISASVNIHLVYKQAVQPDKLK